MREWLYKMQLSQYRGRAYWRLRRQKTTGQRSGQLHWTPRLRRLAVVSWLLVGLGLGLPYLFGTVTVAVANTLLWPYESWHNHQFIRRAQKKLQRRSDLIRIGITGSYGKTSVKNILQQMLATKYRVVASPASFNTPLGFARTVNQYLKPDTQIFIMEMGARHPQDIRALCRLVRPQHGIITSIGACHLATFGSIAQVAQAKAALLASLPSNGIAVTDGDNPWCASLTRPSLIRVQSATAPVYATNLLGAHQQKNIQLAAALAQALGVSAAAVQRVAQHLVPTPHRLEKIVAANGIIILDDSYNANPVSAASALQVLSTFAGKKVVQTPGFVEQGDNQTAAHWTLAAQIGAVADAIIIVGELNRAVLATGFQQAATAKPIFYVPTREAAKKLYPQLLTRGDVLLLLNDLPEQYGR